MTLQEAFFRFPNLRTERLNLRALQDQDAKSLFQLYNDAQVTRYLDWDGLYTEREAMAVLTHYDQQYRNGQVLRWGIDLQDELIGTAMLANFQKGAIADLGYDLAHSAWGKGYMQEALTEILRYAVKELNLIRIQAYVSPDNTASTRLLDKLGFAKEGLLRKAGYHETHKFFYDVLLFALCP